MKTLLFCLLSFTYICKSEEIPKGAKALIDNYPQIKTYENNRIIFKDGSSLLYDDGKKKSVKELLENPDLEEQYNLENEDTTIFQVNSKETFQNQSNSIKKFIASKTSDSQN